MTDADIQDYIADNQGYTSNNPFRKLPYGGDEKDQLSFDNDQVDDDPDSEFYEEDDSLDILSDGDDVDYDSTTDY
jgi:hypothetical protein